MGSLQVANTIVQQLGGERRLSAMIGAKDFVGDEVSVTFKWKAKAKNKANCLQVILDPDDTYTLRFYKIGRGFDVSVIKEQSGVYADGLIRSFESATGLRLGLF